MSLKDKKETFLASSASRQALSVEITKALDTDPWNNVGDSGSAERQVPELLPLKTCPPGSHICAEKRQIPNCLPETGGRGEVDTRWSGGWASRATCRAPAYIPLGLGSAGLFSFTHHLLCNLPASRRALTQVLQEAEICCSQLVLSSSVFWPQSLASVLFSEVEAFWWLFFHRSSLGGAISLLD